MEPKENEEMKKKLTLAGISDDIRITKDKLIDLSENFRGYLDRLETYKDEVEELISCIDMQVEQLEQVLEDVEDETCEICSKCGKSIGNDDDSYEVSSSRGRKTILCSSCYHR